jgi:chromate reductase, NAD(P)H dehydrogenase (quinone)
MTHVIGLSGSLRSGSYNTALLHAATRLMPEGVTRGCDNPRHPAL